MNKTIVHVDLDTFFVSCERLKNSALKDIPLLIGGKSDRGVVASCSYEAREYGIHSAMPMRMAMTDGWQWVWSGVATKTTSTSSA